MGPVPIYARWSPFRGFAYSTMKAAYGANGKEGQFSFDVSCLIVPPSTRGAGSKRQAAAERVPHQLPLACLQGAVCEQD